MQISYEFTRKDMRALEIFLLKKHFLLSMFSILCLVILLYSAVLGVSRRDYFSSYWGLLFFVLVAVLSYSRIVTRNRRLKPYGSWTVLLSDEGVTSMPPNGNKVVLPWRNLHSVHQSKRYVFILVTSAAAIAIPRSSLPPENEMMLTELLQKNAGTIGSNMQGRRKMRKYPIFSAVVIAFVIVVALIDYATRP